MGDGDADSAQANGSGATGLMPLRKTPGGGKKQRGGDAKRRAAAKRGAAPDGATEGASRFFTVSVH